MGVHWAAGLMRWWPHKSRDGTVYSLSHLHPFRFIIELEAYKGLPARAVEVHVGFSMHMFTCDLAHAEPDSEVYRDDREQRAFDRERYGLSQNLRSTISGLEGRKCFHAKNENFFIVELDRIPAGREYRVFFSVRKKTSSSVELIVQSAYLGNIGLRPRGQTKKPVGFRVILMEAIRGRRPKEPC